MCIFNLFHRRCYKAYYTTFPEQTALVFRWTTRRRKQFALYAATNVKVRIRMCDISHVTPLWKNYMVQIIVCFWLCSYWITFCIFSGFHQRRFPMKEMHRELYHNTWRCYGDRIEMFTSRSGYVSIDVFSYFDVNLHTIIQYKHYVYSSISQIQQRSLDCVNVFLHT
jgi:hypothetical protein